MPSRQHDDNRAGVNRNTQSLDGSQGVQSNLKSNIHILRTRSPSISGPQLEAVRPIQRVYFGAQEHLKTRCLVQTGAPRGTITGDQEKKGIWSGRTLEGHISMNAV